MLALIQLMTVLPEIFDALHAIIIVVEKAFPNASGAQKLDHAVGFLSDAVPAITGLATDPAIRTGISALVGVMNVQGGALHAIANGLPIPAAKPSIVATAAPADPTTYTAG